MSHIVRTVIGVGLLILGVIGSLLPVVPGFVFFAAGIAVLGTDHVIVRRFQPVFFGCLKRCAVRIDPRRISAAGTSLSIHTINL